jgi:hypothetical protein
MLVIAACLLFVFWLRDYIALRTSPPGKAFRRALAYGSAIVATAMIVWARSETSGMDGVVKTIHSPRTVVLLIAFHVLASVAPIWVRQTGNYQWMWAMALLPAPIVWVLLLETAVGYGLGLAGLQVSVFAVAVLWAASMVVAIYRSRNIQMPIEDLEFAPVLGGLSHWLAMCVLPVAFFVLE